MGGRRARSVIDFVGAGLPSERGQVTRAVKAKDPTALARNTAKLVARSEKSLDIVYYATKLSGFIHKVVESGTTYSLEQRKHLAEKEWGGIKRKYKIPDDEVRDGAIVRAAAFAISRPKKRVS